MSGSRRKITTTALERFHPAVRTWFAESFPAPTEAQILGWPAISGGNSTLILAPTGSGKTLTAFLWCIDRLMFSPEPQPEARCRAIYISPLKALAVDVERNLRAPVAGIANVASRTGIPHSIPSIATRTGDTPPSERARFARHSADILITTPESFYLLLTSNAREMLRSVDTVIIDEIHALVPTKRGSHLALSLERLDAICERPPQRIGLSATQRPLEEVARFLGGAERRMISPEATPGPPREEVSFNEEFAEQGSVPSFRPVAVVDTGERKKLSLIIETPVEEMGALGAAVPIPSGPASSTVRSSIWPAIHPRLLELIRSHRSTLIFVNSRRLAERLAAALNELAGEPIVSAHHGSVAREQRIEIEDNLKSGRIPALVATSSLELGIDMGAIDLVIQIEAPPSIASGMQRIGRASHQVGATSEGILFPKHRADLVACAAVTSAMREGRIEPIRYPRNPLDVLAQQIVAMVAMDSWKTEDLFAAVRTAAPFAELTRSIFEGVLDMLSGLYPSDDFAELRPRITWNRLDNSLTARPGAKRVAVTNGGTIPDRGLYGVFLAGAEKGSARVGELDEEMVFESSPGETFLLGASTWRIEEITHDRVLVTPAPGEPGKMPFWHGDSASRSVQLGEQIGSLVRQIATGGDKLIERLGSQFDLNAAAARNLVDYIEEQKSATEVVPDDHTILIERCPDDLGDWRVCVLSPHGGRIHAPWAMAATAKVRRETGLEVETMWSDDGFIIRFPETDQAPDVATVIPSAEEVESLVIRQLGSSALFAAKFREVATRALLLPRRTGNRRSPLWQQRKRSADLLQVAARYGSFPMVLETYRECLQDVFDMPALIQLLGKLERRTARTVTADTSQPSPFAGSVLFRYIANYIYDGDAPLAERRAQALAIDHSQLRELLGEAELRDLLDADALEETGQRLQHLDPEYRAKSPDQIHDMLLSIGDLTREELAARSASSDVMASAGELIDARRVVETMVAGQRRLIAVEDASRYRDALGAPIPQGIPQRLLESVRDPLGDLISRYARTHGPFTLEEIASRFALGPRVVEGVLRVLLDRGRLVEGEFRPGGMTREWCDANVLRLVRRRSLAKLRHEVEPVEPQVLGRLFTAWQGIGKKRRGVNALLETVESLQGCPLPASILESEILAVRVEDYRPSDLDTLTAAGEVAWIGIEPLGERDGRIALYLTDTLPLLHSPAPEDLPLTDTEAKIVEFLASRGASFYAAVHLGIGDGFPADTIDALWNLVWKRIVTNDTVHSLRAFTRPKSRGRASAGKGFRSRRSFSAPPAAEGRWSLTADLIRTLPNRTVRSAALASQLLSRYGVLTREAAAQEQIAGGFSAVYDVLKQMEEGGKVRRGYFIDGVAATQFALPGALDLLRSLRVAPDEPQIAMIAATDPVNPWGGILSWPAHEQSVRPTRSVGARVLLVNGSLAAYLSRGEKQIYTWIPEDEPERSLVARRIAGTLADLVRHGARRALLITEIDGVKPDLHTLGPWLAAEGFVPTSMGYQMRALHSARVGV